MSLFIGSDTNTNSILHVTDSANNLTDMKSPVNIASTSFHSNNPFLSINLHSRLTSYSIVSPPGISGTYAVLFTLTQAQKNVLATTNWVGFGYDAYGVYATIRGSLYWDYNTANSPSSNKVGFKVFKDYTTGVLGIGQYLGTSGYNYSAPTTIPYFDIYTTSEIQPSGTGITIGNNTIKIGNIDLLDYSYLNVIAINNLDTTYGSIDGMNIQVLNSKKGETGTSLSMRHNSIYTVYNSIEHLIFGNGYRNTTMILTSTTVSSVTSITFPIYVDDRLAIVTVEDDLSGGPKVPFIFNTNISVATPIYFYYTGPSDVFEYTSYIWVVYNASTGIFRIEDRGAYSNPADYTTLSFTGKYSLLG